MGWGCRGAGTGAEEGGRTSAKGPVIWALIPRAQRAVGQAYHVDELGYGQPKTHDDHVRGVGHWPRPAVVSPKEVFEEAILGLGVGGSRHRHCGTGRESGVSRSPWWWVPNSFSHQIRATQLH